MTLCTHDLSLMRGNTVIVEELTLRVARGEVLHVRGPNGAGKTTLLRCLAGLTLPEHGDVTWESRSIRSDEGAYRERLLHIGHRPALSGRLTPLENLTHHRDLHHPSDLSCLRALEVVGLAAMRDRVCGALSAGQQRRAALGRLLTERAAVWILDEPFAALDEAGFTLVASLIAQHAETGGLAVVTSHRPLPLAADHLLNLDLGPTSAT